ncbi:MAG: sulfite dehydrogenase [Kordiimonadaceae bacterium]|jgi:sulfane dehydrogenase subunit SoxC|nr:sulfite dehydrogenase [Kordiimonadaceae bacterium]MBT6034989.1 sulfite dehydrogenase [Kordiimonadaceae bacterium]MBT6328308.1 sulfite dehydrogenase [Kordiimonadaceae bacterium]MBT7582158.1 sulfite dehydrogenase [Kordiimonadaceae bacterium]
MKTDLINKPTRRHFMQAGVASSAALLSSTALAQETTLIPSRGPGDTIDGSVTYASRSPFVKDGKMRGSANGLSGGGITPLQNSQGMVTPSGLHFEVHHSGVPEIDPSEHKLLIHGLVGDDKIFTMEDLMRFPSVSHFHFLECAGNGMGEWMGPRGQTVQQTHGLTSCSQWTGVSLKVLLNELGVRGDAKWLLAEGDDGARMTRSIPMWKAMDDAYLAYAQNGEFLRPEQGFPLRLIVPGFEGNMNVKWIRRLEVGDKPWWTHHEVTEYADPRPDDKIRAYSFVMEARSVITSPSAGMKLNGPGFYEISGLGWSGAGTVSKVEVSTDGGNTWQNANLQAPVLPKCHTRFTMPWNWDGKETTIMSRTTDDTGYTQPTYDQMYKLQGPIGMMHNNAIQNWHIAQDGEITNVRS